MQYGLFEAVLEDFITCAEYWADYFTQISPDMDVSASAMMDLSADPGFLRG
jgi:hypothetical protein